MEVFFGNFFGKDSGFAKDVGLGDFGLGDFLLCDVDISDVYKLLIYDIEGCLIA